MKSSNFYLKKVFLSMLGIIFLGIFPRYAHATVPVWDVGSFGSIPYLISPSTIQVEPAAQHNKESYISGLTWQGALSQAIPSWDGVSNIIAKTAIVTIKNSLIQWIKGGFSGKPYFLQDPEKFFTNMGEQASGIFIQDMSDKLGLTDPATGKPILCQPNFGIQFQLDIQYGTPDYFNFRSKCTLTQVIDNVDRFYNKFSDGGGWQSFIRIQKSNNNHMGFYTMSLLEEQRRREQAEQVFRNSAQYGGGYLPSVTCARNENTALGCRKFEIHTPSKAIADRVTQTLGIDYGELISADEISEVITAVLDTAIETAVKDFMNN